MIEIVVDKLIGLMGIIATMSKENRELRDNALRAISTALLETKIYYQYRQTGHPRNLDTEAQLAKYWSAAAIPLRHIDRELARTCENKADFLIGAGFWTDERAEDLGLKLQDITKAYRKLAKI